MLLVGLDLPLKVLPLIRLLLVHVHAATGNQYVCMPIEKNNNNMLYSSLYDCIACLLVMFFLIYDVTLWG